MGHRHTSEEQGGQRAVCRADGGFAAPARGSVVAQAFLPVPDTRSVEPALELGWKPLTSVRGAALPSAANNCAPGENGFSHGRPFVGARHAVPAQADSVSVRLALFALRFYKAYLSLLVGGSCRFEPTCSRYAYEAIERFGVARGIWLALKRLARCHPFSGRFGFDPVPETWDETSSAHFPQVSASPVVHHEVGT
jgi:uncharacterized protein